MTLLLPVLVAIGVIIFAALNFSLEEPPLSLNEVKEFDTGWSRVTLKGSTPLGSLPLLLGAEDSTVIIRNTLPDTLDRNAALGVKAVYQCLSVYIGDKLVYEIGYKDKAAFGKAYGYLWNFVPLDSEYAGQTITLVYSSPLNVSKMGIEGILLGKESAVFMHIIRDNLFMIVLCGILLIAGVFFLIIRFILRYKYPNVKWSGLTYLAFFFLLVVAWLFTDSDLTQFIPNSRTVFYLTSFYSFMLLPIPFLLFIDEFNSEKRKSLFVLAILFSLNIIVSTLLYVLNIYDLIQTINSTHFLMLVSLVIGVIIYVKEIRRSNTAIRDIAIGTACLFICSFISILQYYYFKPNFNMIFKYGLFIYVFFISSAAIKRYFLILNSSISAATYKKLAYTDCLSGLGNRTAFSEAVDLLQKSKSEHESIALIVFDIDNLKPVNDSLGHLKGDELIVAVSRCLNSAFSGTGQCFRIGGDEFAAIILDVPEEIIELHLKKLEKCLSIYNEKIGGSIGLSIGFEFCKRETVSYQSIYDIYGKADAKMYENKRSKEPASRR